MEFINFLEIVIIFHALLLPPWIHYFVATIILMLIYIRTSTCTFTYFCTSWWGAVTNTYLYSNVPFFCIFYFSLVKLSYFIPRAIFLFFNYFLDRLPSSVFYFLPTQFMTCFWFSVIIWSVFILGFMSDINKFSTVREF